MRSYGYLNIFGGYRSTSWRSANNYVADSSAFLFHLSNTCGVPPCKYSLKDTHVNQAIYDHSNYGPTFGGGLGWDVPLPVALGSGGGGAAATAVYSQQDGRFSGRAGGGGGGGAFNFESPTSSSPSSYHHPSFYPPHVGHDLQLIGSSGHSSLGHTYTDAYGHGPKAFTGSSNFTLEELEVFLVVG